MTRRTLIVGDVIDDIIVKPRTPVTIGSDTVSQIVRCPGGSAANQAAWLAHCGGRVTFAGRVGRDGLQAHSAHLQTIGVEPVLTADPDAPTGTIVLLVDDGGERTMFTDRAANLRLQAADVPLTLLDEADHLHLTGYSFFTEPVRAVVMDLMRHARRRGLSCSVDPSSVGFLREVGAQQFLGWTAGADIFFPNHDECAVLSGHTDPRAIITELAAHYRLVVLKLGDRGCAIAGQDISTFEVAAVPTHVEDSTGAGDAFAGAFLHHWLAGGTPRQAATEAVSVAAQAVGRLGGRPPHRDRLAADPTQYGGSSFGNIG
jgi:sugar/nucleoside kinase (ribokinase family)